VHREGEQKQQTDLASRKRERSIMTASHVLCFSCSSIAVNFRRMIDTIRSISFGAIGRVRLCSRSRFTTWLVNSLHAWVRNTVYTQSLNQSIKNMDRLLVTQFTRAGINRNQKLAELTL